jgi:hypothetical protein
MAAGGTWGAGFMCLRTLRSPVPASSAQAASLGIAFLAVLATWATAFHIPEGVSGIALLLPGAAGVALFVRDRQRQRRNWMPKITAAQMLLTGAMTIPVAVLLPTVFVQAGVPDYVHDGATHAELVEALRNGTRVAGFDWYPIGFHAPIAAWLSLVPNLDTATGIVGWAIAMTLLAPIAMFGFTIVLSADATVAAASALLLMLTYLYPFGSHLYSVWPMAAGLVMVVGLWSLAVEFLKRPAAQVAALAGLVAAGLILTHGTEIYTAAIGLVAIGLMQPRSVASTRFLRGCALALVVGGFLIAPYVATVVTWAAAGGAFAVGIEYFEFRQAAIHETPLDALLFWSSGLSSGLLVDLPVRVALVGVGVVRVWPHRRQRALIVLLVVFVALVAAFRYIDSGLVRTVFALTLPWGVDDRLLMTVPLLAAPLGGIGAVAVARRVRESSTRETSRAGFVTWRRTARWLRALAIAGVIASTFLVAEKFLLQTNGVVTYTLNDGAAFTWLRDHAQPGDTLMNDGAADAGVWEPYKGHMPIALPRTNALAPDSPERLVRANVGRLEKRLDAQQAACALHIRYVYRGEANSPSEVREFPSLEQLRASSALQEVFSRGEAAIFRTELTCAS